MPATQKEWIKRLQREGWTLDRGGKHQVKVTKPGYRPITLPENKRRILEGLRGTAEARGKSRGQEQLTRYL